MTVEAQLTQILLEILDISEEDILPTSAFIDDLGATSINLVEIFIACQNTFGLEMEAPDVAKLKTVQDVIDLVKGAIAHKGRAS